MLGRHPRLPIDSLFDFREDGDNLDGLEYISEHLKRMRTAYEKAGEHLRKEAISREDAQSSRVSDHSLKVGTRVLIKNRVQGRNKIQDKWQSKQFIVLKCLDFSRNIYLIEPIDKSGPSRVENRTNLRECKFKIEDDSSSDEDIVAIEYNGHRQLRRSTRSNFGKHSNVNHEPRSAV